MSIRNIINDIEHWHFHDSKHRRLKMKGKYSLIDMYEGTYVIAKNIALNTLKAKAKEYHWETDGECMLAYIKADTNGKYHLKDRRPVYTSWDETENGNTTVYVEL